MKTIKARTLAPGMKLTMNRWVRHNTLRENTITVKSVESRDPFRATVIAADGEREVYDNGEYVAINLSGVEVRVTFKLDDEKYPLYVPTAGRVTLADKNGETALWNVLSRGVYQLPDDECCDSKHNADELMEQGYTII